MAAELRVRAAERRDMPRIHQMIHELATFEGMPDGPQLSADDLILDGFDSSPAWFFGLVAECGDEMVGYALCNRAYSSWTRRAFYVEDLYVVPAARRGGVGRALLALLCQMAVSEGVTRIDWHVLENNESGRAFYAGIGARDLRVSEGRTALRLDQEYIAQLAAHNGKR